VTTRETPRKFRLLLRNPAPLLQLMPPAYMICPCLLSAVCLFPACFQCFQRLQCSCLFPVCLLSVVYILHSTRCSCLSTHCSSLPVYSVYYCNRRRLCYWRLPATGGFLPCACSCCACRAPDVPIYVCCTRLHITVPSHHQHCGTTNTAAPCSCAALHRFVRSAALDACPT